MAERKKRPQVYWFQNDTEINISVDLLLDDMLPNIKIEDRFLSLEAYGFGSKDNGPHEYYFSLNLFETIDVDASMDNISTIGSQLKFVLRKQNPKIWWSRLTAQPQKQNWIHIDEKSWISRDSENLSDDENKEYRDIRTDYPGVDDFVQKEELGYRIVDRRTIYLLMYNLYQFIAYFYVFIVLIIELNRDGLVEASKFTYKTVGAPMKCSQFLQYMECLHALVGYTKGSALFPFLQVTGRNLVLFAVINSEPRIQDKPIILCLFLVWSAVELIRYPYYIMALMKTEISWLTWLRYSVWVILYPLGFMCEGLILLISLSYFEESKRYTIGMPNKWNFTFNMVIFLKIYMTFVLLPGLYVVMKHMQSLRVKKLKKPTINCSQSNDGPIKRKTI